MVLEREKKRPEEENDGGVPRLRSFAAPVRDKVIPVDLKPFCDSKYLSTRIICESMSHVEYVLKLK